MYVPRPLLHFGDTLYTLGGTPGSPARMRAVRRPDSVRAIQVSPGDVLVLRAGDVRQVASLTVLENGLVGINWGDGRHSLVDVARVFPRLASPLTQRQAASRMDPSTTHDPTPPQGGPDATD